MGEVVTRRSFLLGTMATLPALMQNTSQAAQVAPRSTTAHSIEKIHQILIVEDLGTPRNLHKKIVANIDSLKACYPEASHTLWHGEAIREIMADNFDPGVLRSFDALKPHAFKADLAKYCLVYLFGGLYADLGLTQISRLKIPKAYGFAGFLHPKGRCSWLDMSTSQFWAPAGRRELAMTIDKVVENCRVRFRGAHAGEITSSTQLGLSCAEVMIEDWRNGKLQDQWIGKRQRHLIDGEKRVVMVAKDGSVAAIRRRDRYGDWSSMSTEGVNNYDEMWDRGEVYTG